MKPAVVIIGHGSRDPEGNREFRQLVELFRAHDPEQIVECGFLEFSQPLIQEGIDRCVARGAHVITLLPGMLMAAGHIKRDIPQEIQEAQRRYPEVTFYYGRHLHLHPKIIELCKVRITEATQKTSTDDRKDTLLLVVSRGSSDIEANADIQKLSRILWESFEFGWATACYIGVTRPLLPEALERCHRLGYPRIIVFPFLLFTGVLEKLVRQISREFATQHPETEILLAGHLNAHPLLLEAFLGRFYEAIQSVPGIFSAMIKNTA